MKKGASLLFATCLLAAKMSAAQNHAPAFANPTQPILVEGVDVSPLVEEINKSIITLKKPVLVYHWFQGNEGSVWTRPLSMKSPYALQYLQNSSQGYLNDFGNDTTGNMYGRGLYAALDPVTTRGYGGQNWVLTEIKFPKGLRILDLWSGGVSVFSQKSTDVLKSLNCTQITSLSAVFQGAINESADCKSNLRKVLKGSLNFQAFAYGYSSSFFDECTELIANKMYPSGRRSTAFVIVDSSWLKPELVKVFNSKTTEEPETRSLIFSLFYKADRDGLKPEAAMYSYNIRMQIAQQMFKETYPDFYMTGIEQDCKGGPDNCVNVYKLIKNVNGQPVVIKVPEPPMPTATYPQKISKDQIPFSSKIFGTQEGLLWPDLEGRPTVSDLSPWIKNNLYGCSAVDDEIIRPGKKAP